MIYYTKKVDSYMTRSLSKVESYVIQIGVMTYFCIGIFLSSVEDFLVLQSIGSLQKKYSIGSFELLSKTAPYQALSLIVLGPFIDYFLNGKFLLTYKMSSGALVSTYYILHTTYWSVF